MKTIYSSNMKRKWYFSEIFHTHFCFDMFYAVESSEVEITNTVSIPIIATQYYCIYCVIILYK